MLLEANANANVDVDRRERVFGNALQVASCHSHTKVVDRLLFKRPDVKAEDGIFGKILRAALAGSHDMVALELSCCVEQGTYARVERDLVQMSLRESKLCQSRRIYRLRYCSEWK